MKQFILFFFVLGLGICSAQPSELFTFDWKLTEIVTEDDTFVATPYPSPEDGSLEHIFFDEYNGVYSFIFGYYGNGVGDDLIFDTTTNNSSFEISYFYNHFGGYSPAESFFSENFIYADQTQSYLHNPFEYSFRLENNSIYLDITNNVGNVATFFDTTLSQTDFEQPQLTLHPNPVTNTLFIKNLATPIGQVMIFDQQGKLVFKKQNLLDHTIDVSILSQGLFIIKLSTKKGSFYKKFLKN